MIYKVVLRIGADNCTDTVITNYREFTKLTEAMNFFASVVKTTTRQSLKDKEHIIYTIFLYENDNIIVGTKIDGSRREVNIDEH